MFTARWSNFSLALLLLWSGACGIGTHREIRLETGLRHGFLYRPLKEWTEPAIAWTRRR